MIKILSNIKFYCRKPVYITKYTDNKKAEENIYCRIQQMNKIYKMIKCNAGKI